MNSDPTWSADRAIEALNLDRTALTDAGLTHLKGLTGLRFVNLVGARVDATSVREVQYALPMLRVFR
jgi:hypothetical protein